MVVGPRAMTMVQAVSVVASVGEVVGRGARRLDITISNEVSGLPSRQFSRLRARELPFTRLAMEETGMLSFPENVSGKSIGKQCLSSRRWEALGGLPLLVRSSDRNSSR